MSTTTRSFTALLLITVFACGEFSDPGRAVRTMESAGYKDVKVTGQHGIKPEWHNCSESDDVSFDVTATNPAGQRVPATVCCGVGMIAAKGCTIRY